ncbi:hypothetical protein ABE504_11710 [Paenibacillus oryzisoli]|uniref:golvesin C-terminal-like domain-containing protein n=1 Tax=Paenibacillus oryzisoli TaxID=1850517 RepID=UPI003D27FBF7
MKTARQKFHIFLICTLLFSLLGYLTPGMGTVRAASKTELLDNAYDRFIDNTDAEKVPGEWTSSTFRTGFEGADYLYASKGTGSVKITWRPNLAISGTYKVYYRLPNGTTNSADIASNAPFTVNSASGTTTILKNQRAAGGDYVELGEFSFAAGTSGYVQLTNQVDSQYVLADAVIFDWVPPVQDAAVAPMILDNTNLAAADIVGTWSTGTSRSNKYGSNYLAVGNGPGDKQVTWRATFTKTGKYGVYYWVPDSLSSDNSIADDAPYTIKHALGEVTIRATQRGVGGHWNKLGSFLFIAGEEGTVRLTNQVAANNVIADAIKFDYEPTVNDIIVDNVEAVQGTHGVGWTSSSFRPNAYGGSYYTSSNDVNTVQANELTWTPYISKAGYYNVYYWLPESKLDDTTIASNAPFTIHYASGEETVNVNERQEGKQWVRLGSYPFAEGIAGNVHLSNNADGIVVADAIRFVPLEVTTDNTDTTAVTPTGSWTASSQQPNFQGQDYLVSPAGQGENTVVWRPTLDQTGYYTVSLWHPDDAGNAASNAMAIVTAANVSAAVYVNQKENGGQWNSLGSFLFNKGSSGNVSLSNDANGKVYADALRFTYTGVDLFYDDFTRDDQSQWTRLGNWQRSGSGNHYELQANTGSPISSASAFVGGQDWKHYAVQTTVTPASVNGEFGLITRYQADGSYYLSRYNAVTHKFEIVKKSSASETVLAQSDLVTLSANQPIELQVNMKGPQITLFVNGQSKAVVEDSSFLSGKAGLFAKGLNASFQSLSVFAISGPTTRSGNYTIQGATENIIKGLGFEIQSDSIGSDDTGVGLPQAPIGVPHDLAVGGYDQFGNPAELGGYDANGNKLDERERLAKEMLSGFRYMRLAGGLYYRGTTEDGKQLKERWPTQLTELSKMITDAKVEGVDFEYWSPTPFYKTSGSYIGGVLKVPSTTTVTGTVYHYDQFAQSVWTDLKYLMDHNIPITAFGLQNESINYLYETLAGHPLNYSHSPYTATQYVNAMKEVAPLLKQKFADLGKPLEIHADSWDGQHSSVGQALSAADTADPACMSNSLIADKSYCTLVNNIDAWTFHRIGYDSNTVISEADHYKDKSLGKPVYQNEFEYFGNQLSSANFVNTAQSVMNWFTFVNSPTWYWLHALKPLYNSEATGFSLGFWRASDDDPIPGEPHANLEKGHWEYNNKNWNALAGFLKYMPWDSVRYAVNEPKDAANHYLTDNRIMAWKAPAVKNPLNTDSLLQPGKMAFAVTNRSSSDYYTYNVEVGAGKTYKGYRYTEADHGANSEGVEIGTQVTTAENTTITTTLKGYAIEFWVEQ